MFSSREFGLSSSSEGCLDLGLGGDSVGSSIPYGSNTPFSFRCMTYQLGSHKEKRETPIYVSRNGERNSWSLYKYCVKSDEADQMNATKTIKNSPKRYASELILSLLYLRQYVKTSRSRRP